MLRQSQYGFCPDWYGENRAVTAARSYFFTLTETSIEGAKGVLLNITGGNGLGLFEVNEAAEIIAEAADPEANIIFGAVIDESLDEEIKVTVIATGFDQKPKVPEVGDSIKSFSINGFSTEDLEIPAFLRRRR